MLHLVTGRIGCGKTQRIYSEIEKLIKSGKRDILLLVPEQYSFETEKNIVSQMGAQKADCVRVFSFTFLAKHLLKIYGSSNLPEIDDSIREACRGMFHRQTTSVQEAQNKPLQSKKARGFCF